MDRVNMPSTIWAVIHAARGRGSDALDEVIRKYRPAVVAFVRQSGCGPEDAEDLAQEVFLAVLRDDVLAKADRARGKFRSLLLAVARHAISTWRKHDGRLKRGGDRERIYAGLPLEEMLASPAADDGFDTLWIENLVRLGMNRLKDECAQKKSPHYDALALFSTEGLDYAAVAERLGASVTDVKNWLHAGRKRLRELLLEEVESYSCTPEEYRSEVEVLLRLLK
jgi:RNA polymerase sigma-70 factor (ECF subfamily)